jgi:hypothetical protein
VQEHVRRLSKMSIQARLKRPRLFTCHDSTGGGDNRDIADAPTLQGERHKAPLG